MGWRLLKRVHVVYASGLLHQDYAPGTSCEQTGGEPGSKWWGVMPFPIVEFVGLGGGFELFGVYQTFVK